MAFNISKNRVLSEGIKLLKCGECGRSASPLAVGGNGGRGILVVFDMPSDPQVQQQNWFVGESTVFKLLQDFGLNLQQDIWVTAILPCAGAREQVRYEACLPKLQEMVILLKPSVIVTAGSVATGAVCRAYCPAAFGGDFTTGQYVGQCIPLTMPVQNNQWDCWLVPVFGDKDIHANQQPQTQQVAKDWVRKHLAVALGKTERPARVFKDEYVELEFDTKKITASLDQACKSKYVAFDYETNSLGFYTDDAKVLSASICMADSDRIYRTVAFPMASELVKQKWCEFLQSPAKKIAANCKFEESVNLMYFKTPATNWFADTCVLARVLDCMPGNSGLKFATFTQLGELYAMDVEQYMSGEDGGLNRLNQCPMETLLKYNGMDSWFTMYLTKRYYEILGLPF